MVKSKVGKDYVKQSGAGCGNLCAKILILKGAEKNTEDAQQQKLGEIIHARDLIHL